MKKSIKNKAIAILACLFAIALSCTFLGGNVSFAKAEGEDVAAIVTEFKGYVDTIKTAIDPASGELSKTLVEEKIANKNYSSAILAANRLYKDVNAVENPDEELTKAIKIFAKAKEFTAEPIALYNYLTSTLYDQIKASAKTPYVFGDGLTLASEEVIKSYQDRYNALVGNYKVMVDDNAENAANFDIALDIIAEIKARMNAANEALDNILVWDGAAMAANKTLTDPGEVVLKSKETIDAARTALDSIYAGTVFENIPAAELAKIKEVVTNYDKYFGTSESSQKQEKAMNDILKAISDVETLISTAKNANEETGKKAFEVGKVTKTIESYITAAKTGFDALPDATDKGGNNDQQGAVNNSADLTAMVEALTDINRRIDAAIAAIALLGDDVNDVKVKVKYGASADTIAAALAACNALDEDVKGGAEIVTDSISVYVTNYDVYLAAVAFYKNMNDKVDAVVSNIFNLKKDDPNIVSAFNKIGYDAVNKDNYGAENAAAMLEAINTARESETDRVCFDVYEEFRALVNKINAEADKIFEILQKAITWIETPTDNPKGVKPDAELKTLIEEGRTELNKYVNEDGSFKGETEQEQIFNSQIIAAVSNKAKFEKYENEFKEAVAAVEAWKVAVSEIMTMDFAPESGYAETIANAVEKWNALNDTLKNYAQTAETAIYNDYTAKVTAYNEAKEKLDNVANMMAELNVNALYETHAKIATFKAAVEAVTVEYSKYIDEGSDVITGAAAYIAAKTSGELEVYKNYLAALDLVKVLNVVDNILSIPTDDTTEFNAAAITIADTTIETARNAYEATKTVDEDGNKVNSNITNAIDAYYEGKFKAKLDAATTKYDETKESYDALIERVEAYVKINENTHKYDLATVINVNFDDLKAILAEYNALDTDAKHYLDTHVVNETLASDIVVEGTFVAGGTFEKVYKRAYTALRDLLGEMIEAVNEGGYTPEHIETVAKLNARYAALADTQKNTDYDEGATIVYSVRGTEIADLVNYYKNTFSNEYSKNVLVNYFEKACEKVYENVITNHIYTQDTAVELYTLHALFASMTEYQASLAEAKDKLDEATRAYEAATDVLNINDLKAKLEALSEIIGTVTDESATGILGDIKAIKEELANAASSEDVTAIKERLEALEKALSDQINALNESLTTKENELKKAYADADAELKKAIEKAYAEADTALEGKIKLAYEAAIATSKSELERKLADQKTAYETAIANAKSELAAKDAELETKINTLTSELNSTKSALEAKDKELEDMIKKVEKDLTEKYDGEVKSLKDTITVISVIFGILIAACAACVVVLFVKKK
jgi:hypothetical protein